MRTSIGLIVTTTAVALLSACASGSRDASMSWNLGVATPNDVETKSIEVLRQRRYEIERTEAPPYMMVITRWRDRLPFEDERALGVVEARTRFIVEARPRSRESARNDPYTVRLRAENQGRLVGGGDFAPIATTPAFQAYADEISEELRTVLLMGIRGP